MHASHLRVWQTELSNIASSCFDIDKTLNQHDISSEGTLCHTCSSNFIYIYMSVTVKILDRKK